VCVADELSCQLVGLLLSDYRSCACSQPDAGEFWAGGEDELPVNAAAATDATPIVNGDELANDGHGPRAMAADDGAEAAQTSNGIVTFFALPAECAGQGP